MSRTDERVSTEMIPFRNRSLLTREQIFLARARTVPALQPWLQYPPSL